LEKQLHNQGEVCEPQQEAQMNSQGTEDENKAKLDSPALEIEVDHAEDNVSTLRDFEPLSEEIFDDRTVGFSTVEFCTVYKNNLYGNNLAQPLRKNQVKEMLNLLTFLNCQWKVALVPQSILELIQGILQMTLLP